MVTFAAGMFIEHAKRPLSILTCFAIAFISLYVTVKVVEQHTTKTAVQDTVVTKRLILRD
ncbi:MAG: hypothetical protein AAB364_02985 [Patescibacteria group bacterium]